MIKDSVSEKFAVQINKLQIIYRSIFIVNEFSDKFAFVFVHGSFLLNSSFLPSFVTFYRSLLQL